MRTRKRSIPCNFVGRFKVGDNIVYNAEILCSLARKNKDSLFNKLMIIQIASIIEASLTEIIFRAQNFNKEGVPKISKEDQTLIAGKQVDTFNNIINVLSKHSALNTLRHSIYKDLHTIKTYRNKVHIQKTIKIDGLSNDEADIFSDNFLEWSLKLNFEVLSFLSTEMKRPKKLGGYVGDIKIPTVI